MHAKLIKKAKGKSTLEVALKEGRNREVRRVLARVGHEVRRLVRISIGPVDLGRLDTGKVRPLSAEEIDALHDCAATVIRLGGRPPRRPKPAGRSDRSGSFARPSRRNPRGKGSPKGSPKAAPKQSRKGAPKQSLKGAPKRSLKGAPKRSLKGAPKQSRKGAPKRSRKGAPKRSRNAPRRR